jgi:hypothetical protein
MRGKRPYFDLSRGRLSGVGGSWAPNACATSMISGFGGPPDPRVILTPLVVSTCAAEAAGVAGIWTTLAVASGATSFGGAGKISTFATANGWPLIGKSGRGSITRPTAIARIAATVAAPLIGRLSRTANADPAPATKPSGSSSSSHTSVDASRSNVSESRINLVRAYSRPPAEDTRCRGRKSSFQFLALIRVDPRSHHRP